MDDPENPFLVSSSSTTSTKTPLSPPQKRVRRSRRPSISSDRFIGHISESSKATYPYTTPSNPYITPQKSRHGNMGGSEGSEESNASSGGESSGSGVAGMHTPIMTPAYVELSYATPAEDPDRKVDLYTTQLTNAVGLDPVEKTVLRFSSPQQARILKSSMDALTHSPSKSTSSPSQSRQLDRLEQILKTPTKKGNQGSTYSRDLSNGSRATRAMPPKRLVSTFPSLVLDAPDVSDDFYTQLLDWSSRDVVMVAMDRKCYLWSKTGGVVDCLYESAEDDHITTCKFSQDGDLALVTTYEGAMGLFNVSSLDSLHPPVTPLSTGEYVPISSATWVQPVSYALGDTTGQISIFDVRSNPLVPKAVMDTGENAFVVGLSVSCDDVYLASGLNHGKTQIWDLRKTTEPLHSLTNHASAVRALEWCPWQPHLLASGGGYLDGKICLINGDSGKIVKSVETGSQVCQLLWSRHYRELLSSHTDETDQFIFWHYPNMNRLATLKGHECRPLHLGLSPDGTTVASLAGDETLKFWNWFDIKSGQKPLKPTINGPVTDLFSSSIR